MRKIILIAFAIMSFGFIHAQNDSMFVSVSPIKNNIFYFGVENPVSVGVTNLCGQQPIVNVSCGTIKYLGNGHYSVYPDSTCSSVTIVQVSYVSNGNTYVVEETFRNKRIPDPVVKIGANNCNSTIPKSLLLAVGRLSAVLENFDFDVKFNIVSFAISSDANPELINSEGNTLSEPQKNMIKSLKSGESLYFKKVKVKDPENRIRFIGDCVFYIN